MKKFLGIVCLSLLLYCNAYSDIINEIKELNILFKDGYLTKEEFSKAKKILIDFGITDSITDKHRTYTPNFVIPVK